MRRETVEAIRTAAAASNHPFMVPVEVPMADSAVAVIDALAQVVGVDREAIVRAAVDDYLARTVRPEEWEYGL